MSGFSKLWKAFMGQTRTVKQIRNRQPRSHHLLLEILEDRIVPSTVTISETQNGTESGTHGIFSVSRGSDTTGPLTVNYYLDSTSTATSGVDFNSLPGSVTIPDGQSSVNIDVVPIDAQVYGGSKTVILDLEGSGCGCCCGGSSYTVGSPGSATVTIADDDVASTVTISETQNGTESGTHGIFSVSRGSDTTGPLTVNYYLDSTSTATSGVDFNSLPGSVTIPDGQSSVNIDVVPIDAQVYGGSKTVILDLEGSGCGCCCGGSSYTVGSPGSATVTIADDDVPSTVTISETQNGTESGTHGIFSVSRGSDTTGPLTVNYYLDSTSTATSGVDFNSLPGSVTIPDGQSSVNIDVVPIDAQVYGGSKTVILDLEGSGCGCCCGGSSYTVGSPGGATVTIADDDVASTVTISETQNGTESGTHGIFSVSRGSDTTGPLTVNYYLDSTSTATSGVDFNSLPGSVTIPDGQSSVNIDVVPIDAQVYGGSKTVILDLEGSGCGCCCGGSSYTVGSPGSATVTIADDDVASTVTISETQNGTESGTHGIFSVSRGSDTTGPLTVNYYLDSTSTATSGVDFNSLPGSVTIPDGQSSVNIDVVPIDAQVYGGSKTVILDLEGSSCGCCCGGSSYTVGSPGSATVTIADDDVNPVSLTSPGAQTNYDGDTVSLPVAASDAEAHSLSFTATGLPSGMTIDGGTGVITGTIASDADTDSPYSVTVVAADSYANVSATQTFNWAIAQPVINVENSGDPVNFIGDTAAFGVSASDSAGHTLTFSASGLPAGLSIDDATGIISGTVAANAVTGSDLVTVTATDTSANVSANQSFDWTVESTTITLTSPGDQASLLGSSVDVPITASDAAGHALMFSASGLPDGLNIDPSSGIISGTVATDAESSSPYSVTVTATDTAANVGATQSFSWTAAQILLQNPGDELNFDGDTITIPLFSADASNNALVFSATGLPSGVSIDSATGTISGTISNDADANSPYAATITASDSLANVSVNQHFAWTVYDVYLENPGAQTGFDGDTVVMSLAAAGPVSNGVTFSISGLPQGLAVDSATGIISGTIASNADTYSPYSVTVTATDATTSVSTSQSFAWTVQQPTVSLNPIGDQTSFDGDSGAMSVSASDSAGHYLTFTASGLPSGLNIDSSTGVISGTIASNADENAPYTVTVTATDASAGVSANQGLTWTIEQPTLTLSNPGDQAAFDGDVVLLPLLSSDSAGHTLTYSASGLPTGLSVDSATGMISGAIANNADADGPYSVSVTATDANAGLTATQAFSWNVQQTEVTLANPGTQTDLDSDTVDLELAASDVSGNALTFSATGLPSGLTIDSSTGIISGSIASADAGANIVTVSAADAALNKSANVSFVWQVNGFSMQIANRTDNEGSTLGGNTFAIQFQNAPLGTIYSVAANSADQLPNGVTLNFGFFGGTIMFGDAPAGQTRVYNITIVATAPNGTALGQPVAFRWTINSVNPLNAINNQVNNLNDPIALQLSLVNVNALSNGATVTVNQGAQPPTGITSPNWSFPAGVAQPPAFGGSPTAAAATPTQVTVTLNNAGQTYTRTFTWTVNNPNSTNISGPSVVPGNSKYTYTITYAAGVTFNQCQFTYSQCGNASTVSQSSATVNGRLVATIVVQFTNTPANVLLQTQVNGTTVASMPITIVQIQVTNPTFTAGNPAEASKQNITFGGANATTAYSVAITSGTPGFQWSATVTAIGPNGNQGVNMIQAGYIQYANLAQARQTYSNGQTLYNKYNGQYVGQNWYLDQTPNATAVGYYGANGGGLTSYTSFTSASSSVTMTIRDTPRFFAPMSFNLASQPIGGPAPQGLVSTVYDESFQLDVAAQTLDATNNANQLYYLESMATGLDFSGPSGAGVSWAFLANGHMDQGNTWQVDAGGGIASPSAWSAATSIVSLSVAGPIMNSVVTDATISFSQTPP